MNNLMNVNGGFPPIKIINLKKIEKNEKEDLFTKERGFENSTVNIQNIISSKKDEFLKKKEENIEIVDSI